MKKKLKSLLFLVVIITTGVLTACHFSMDTADDFRAFYNGNIITMNEQLPNAQAILLAGDKIEKLGTSAEILALLPEGFEATDLNGRTMTPGIIDAHGHFPGEGIYAVAADLNSPPIGNKHNMQDVINALTKQAAETDPGSWIRGIGFDDTTIAENRHITIQELDAISTEHPIMVMHISAHMVVVNSLALERLNVNDDTPNPEGGEYHKDENGNLTGLLVETAMLPTRALAVKFSTLEAISVMKQASDKYFQQGVTTAQNGYLEDAVYGMINIAARLGLYDIRQVIWPSAKVADDILSGEKSTTAFNNEKFKLGAVKLVADGSIQGYTGYLTHPYHVPSKDREDDYVGYPLQPRQTLIDLVEKYHAAGMQIAIHGNGDASIDDIIAAIENAQNKFPKEDARFIVVHSQMVRDDQLLKYKELGITPTFFNAHVYYWGDRHRDIFIGPDRAKRISPLATTENLGIKFTTHSDSPVVPMTPWLNAWNAVTRETSSGQILGPDQVISRYSALKAMTVDAAWQVFEESSRGSLEVGKLADFVILERDPLLSTDNLKHPGVVSTWVGGVKKFEATQ